MKNDKNDKNDKKSTLYKMANNRLNISFLDVVVFTIISTIALWLIPQQDYTLLVLEGSVFLTAVLSEIYKDNGEPLGDKIVSVILGLFVLSILIYLIALMGLLIANI